MKQRDLIAVLRLGRAIEPKRFGHFDHGANLSTGQSNRKPRRRVIKTGTAKQAGEAHRLSVRYEEFRDAKTGETLYRLVKPK